MSAPAIRVEGLGKRYRIGERVRYKSLRESVSNAALRALRGERRPHETIWALKDVSFEVAPGEVVGVIGRNGAGKSTLLKILSRITEPTEGRVELHGRVGSLLEVGTGFHQELTGRENIYLNGAILGMKRAEIERKFDEIVAFAEIERFLDTPVKHYSTGMYLRLAFAVAAHLEPEILLVDEVLAVGDTAFQKKCLGKMGDVARGGRTVLFVSHNMTAVNQLCRSAVWLDEGTIAHVGAVQEAVQRYLSSGEMEGAEKRWAEGSRAPGNDRISVQAVRVVTEDGVLTNRFDRESPFCFEVEYRLLSEVLSMQVGFWLQNSEGVVVFVGGDAENQDYSGRSRPAGRYLSRALLPGGLLNSGTYYLSLGVDMPVGANVIMRDQVIRIDLSQRTIPRHSAHASWRPPGVLCLSLPWEIRQLGER